MIKGKLINLRLIEETDLETLHKLQCNVEENGPYSDFGLRSIVHMKKKYSDNGYSTKDFAMFLITDKEDKIVGMIQHFKGCIYSTGYELGTAIYKKDDRSRGYVTEAVKLYTAYLFESYPIYRVEIATSTENIGAQKVAEKCGYTFEGINRKSCVIRGKVVDLKRFSILREESPSLISLIE